MNLIIVKLKSRVLPEQFEEEALNCLVGLTEEAQESVSVQMSFNWEAFALKGCSN